MTLAAILAHVACTGSIPVPGAVHDPTQPLVLGNQANNDYAVFTWDAVSHRLTIQSVYKPPGGSLVQSTLTFAPNGQLLINGQPLTSTAEFTAFLAAVQASAAAAAASQGAAATAASNAATSASASATSSTSSQQAASDAQKIANAPAGTPVPGGGASAAASAQEAALIAQESRDLDLSDAVVAAETFEPGFLFTERPVEPVAGAEVLITIPPGIFSSAEKKARWGSYKLRSTTGSVKFVGQPGGNNLVTPTLLKRERAQTRWTDIGTAQRRTIAIAAAVPAVVDGEIVCIFNAQHQGTAQATTMNFTYSGASLTWLTVKALPGFASGVAIPDWYIIRARLTGYAGGTINLNFDEGTNVHFQAVDWFVVDGVDGLDPIFAYDAGNGIGSRDTATLLAVPAQSLLLAVGALGANAGAATWSNMSGNLTRLVAANTSGVAEATAPDTSVHKNQIYQIGSGVATVAGDTEVWASWSTGAFRGGIAALAYRPKSVIGGGTVVMNYEGDRQSLTVPYGTAELWFQPDGKTVHVRTPKP